jgi:hypothetical protein
VLEKTSKSYIHAISEFKEACTLDEQNDQGQGDQGEHEQRYGKEVTVINLFNTHTH